MESFWDTEKSSRKPPALAAAFVESLGGNCVDSRRTYFPFRVYTPRVWEACPSGKKHGSPAALGKSFECAEIRWACLMATPQWPNRALFGITFLARLLQRDLSGCSIADSAPHRNLAARGKRFSDGAGLLRTIGVPRAKSS